MASKDMMLANLAAALANLSGATARTEESGSAAVKMIDASQGQLQSATQKEAEKKADKKKKSGILGQLGSTIAPILLAPVTGGMSLIPAALTNAAGAAAGGALGQMLGGGGLDTSTLGGYAMQGGLSSVLGTMADKSALGKVGADNTAPIGSAAETKAALSDTISGNAPQLNPARFGTTNILSDENIVRSLTSLANAVAGLGNVPSSIPVPALANTATAAAINQLNQSNAANARAEQQIGMQREELGLRREELATTREDRSAQRALEERRLEAQISAPERQAMAEFNLKKQLIPLEQEADIARMTKQEEIAGKRQETQNEFLLKRDEINNAANLAATRISAGAQITAASLNREAQQQFALKVMPTAERMAAQMPVPIVDAVHVIEQTPKPTDMVITKDVMGNETRSIDHVKDLERKMEELSSLYKGNRLLGIDGKTPATHDEVMSIWNSWFEQWKSLKSNSEVTLSNNMTSGEGKPYVTSSGRELPGVTIK